MYENEINVILTTTNTWICKLLKL